MPQVLKTNYSQVSSPTYHAAIDWTNPSPRLLNQVLKIRGAEFNEDSQLRLLSRAPWRKEAFAKTIDANISPKKQQEALSKTKMWIDVSQVGRRESDTQRQRRDVDEQRHWLTLKTYPCEGKFGCWTQEEIKLYKDIAHGLHHNDANKVNDAFSHILSNPSIGFGRLLTPQASDKPPLTYATEQNHVAAVTAYLDGLAALTKNGIIDEDDFCFFAGTESHSHKPSSLGAALSNNKRRGASAYMEALSKIAKSGIISKNSYFRLMESERWNYPVLYTTLSSNSGGAVREYMWAVEDAFESGLLSKEKFHRLASAKYFPSDSKPDDPLRRGDKIPPTGFLNSMTQSNAHAVKAYISRLTSATQNGIISSKQFFDIINPCYRYPTDQCREFSKVVRATQATGPDRETFETYIAAIETAKKRNAISQAQYETLLRNAKTAWRN